MMIAQMVDRWNSWCFRWRMKRLARIQAKYQAVRFGGPVVGCDGGVSKAYRIGQMTPYMKPAFERAKRKAMRRMVKAQKAEGERLERLGVPWRMAYTRELPFGWPMSTPMPTDTPRSDLQDAFALALRKEADRLIEGLGDIYPLSTPHRSAPGPKHPGFRCIIRPTFGGMDLAGDSDYSRGYVLDREDALSRWVDGQFAEDNEEGDE